MFTKRFLQLKQSSSTNSQWSKLLALSAIALSGSATTYYASSDEENRKQMLSQIRSMQTKLLLQHTSPSNPLLASSGMRDHVRDLVFGKSIVTAECQFSDKHLAGCLDKIDKGVSELMKKHPGKKKPVIKSGLRGPSYYIEVPIFGRNLDTFGLMLTTESLIQGARKEQGAKIIDRDSFSKGDSMSYKIDYSVDSSTVGGSKSKGSVYIRGMKSEGVDSFKFVLEKRVDFAELDSQMMINAVEFAIKMQQEEAQNDSQNSTQPRFQARNANKKDGVTKGNQTGDPMSSETGSDDSEDANDPVSVLEKHSCTVFLPDKRENKLDWDYLAGYESIKRSIEDTVLLALTHGDVYDKITALTRMKNETNRPKCVLFEGPPGCGKTTSAKIISHQVQIPLVYMPLEAIMSKFYGESESRLAEIFEAAQAMGSVILFIDEVDALATSREGGLHEATRRILSTLLRKIDSFESEGEVLVICATNRKKDLDPALISRTDLSIRFELPDASTRAQIFQRYAKQLSETELAELGELSVNLSGRDISDICKEAERKWASKYIRKEVTELTPALQVYTEATKTRLLQMLDANLRMEYDIASPYAGGAHGQEQQPQSLAFGGK